MPSTPARTLAFAPIAIAVAIAAFNLRPAIVSVGAVLPDIGLDPTASGVVTALPGMCFAVVGLAAVPCARRVGTTQTLWLACALMAVAQLVRPLTGVAWAFILLTGVAVTGVALTNVLLPAWIKAVGGSHTVALMTAYTALLGLGSAVGPLSAMVFLSWRWAIGVWAIPALVQLVVWGWVLSRVGAAAEPSWKTDSAGGVPIWRSPLAVWLTVFFGLQSMHAYIQMGWLPSILREAGVSEGVAAGALALLGALGIVGGLIVPALVARLRSAGPLVVFFALCTLAGYAGLMAAPAKAPLAWSFLLGVGGFCFVTSLSLIPQRTSTPEVTARLSGFAQPVGYVLAALGPLAVGAARDAIGSWQPVLAALVAAAIALGAAGWFAARPGNVDEELVGRGR